MDFHLRFDCLVHDVFDKTGCEGQNCSVDNLRNYIVIAINEIRYFKLKKQQYELCN